MLSFKDNYSYLIITINIATIIIIIIIFIAFF